MSIEVIPLNPELIHRANYNSFGGERGDHSNAAYLAYGEEILGFPIADSRKETLLKELHKRYSVVIGYEAKHVSVIVTGPSKYNAKKLDHGDDVLRSHAELYEWFDGIRKQINRVNKKNDKRDQLLEMIEFCDTREELDPTTKLLELAFIDNPKFIELFEQLQEKYRWRKNSTIYKTYLCSKAGEIQEIHKETVFEDDNLTAYKEGDRYYIQFVLRPKRQLHIALKSRGWWWNSYKTAYSTYLGRFDMEWVKNISSRYSAYI